MKIAVIGSGASGYSILRRLLENYSEHEICLFDFPSPLSTRISVPKAEKKLFSWGLPQKRFRGHQPERFVIDDKPRFLKSRRPHGLMNYWGANLRPINGREDLSEYYLKVASWLGIAGEMDGLEEFYGKTFFNRPPIPVPAGLTDLRDHINNDKGPFKAGSARLAIETRTGESNNCQLCGECFEGCSYGSVFSGLKDICSWIEEEKIKFFSGEVSRISENTVYYAQEAGPKEENGFDRIFLCAGIIGSTKIAFNSGVQGPFIIQDSPVFQFPLWRWKSETQITKFISYSNLVVAHPEAEIHIHPHSDALLPWGNKWLSPLMKRLNNFLRKHLYWGRLYLNSAHGYHFSLEFKNDQAMFRTIRSPDKKKATLIMNEYKRSLKNSGFWIPPFPVLLAPTSSHLAGPLAMSEWKFKNAYICDTSRWENSPATPLTFTLMAQACQTVDSAL